MINIYIRTMKRVSNFQTKVMIQVLLTIPQLIPLLVLGNMLENMIHSKWRISNLSLELIQPRGLNSPSHLLSWDEKINSLNKIRQRKIVHVTFPPNRVKEAAHQILLPLYA